ncbi:hypothetical protein ABEB36_009299 [Hypothenemus hampei]|uniref:Uncharacterized protein n=1 Tax=Hypothenemus hampei TaxID=57062 RepID=A0ABD1EI12_HYPHA
MLSEEELELKRKIVHAASSIRKKYLALKLERNDKDIAGKHKISTSTPISVRKSAKKSSGIPSRKSVGNYPSSSSNFLSINNDDNDEFYDVSGDDDDEINKSSKIAKQPQQPQQSQNYSVNVDVNDDDDDDITFREPADIQNVQSFLEFYPLVVRPFIYTSDSQSGLYRPLGVYDNLQGVYVSEKKLGGP